MISIIIPVLNEESVLENTLKQLKAGLKIPHEIIVSDGKSKDKTVEIARKYADKVVTYSGEARQTIAQGRNAGAAVASGELFAFLDADCSFKDPDAFFKYAISRFEHEEKLTALVGWVCVLPGMATLADKIIYELYNRYLFLINNIFGLGVSGGEFQMMRNRDFVKIGGYREHLVASEDMDLLNRLSKLGRAAIDHKLVVYHTGRRAHKIGWPKLLYQWISNSLSMMIHDKAASKEWEPIR